MDMGQIMAVVQQMPTGQDGLPMGEAGTQAERGGLFAGLLQDLSAQNNGLIQTVAQNVPREVPDLKSQGDVSLDTLAGLMALAGNIVKPVEVASTESTDKAPDGYIRQNATDSESQNVAVASNEAQLAQVVAQLSAGTPEAAAMPVKAEQRKVQQDCTRIDTALAAQPVSGVNPADGNEVLAMTEQAVAPATTLAAQAATSKSQADVQVKPVGSGIDRARLSSRDDNSGRQVLSEARNAENEHAVLLQKEAAVTERDKQVLQGVRADQRLVNDARTRQTEAPQPRLEGAARSLKETPRQQLDMNVVKAAVTPTPFVQVATVAAPAAMGNPLVVATESRVLQLETPLQPDKAPVTPVVSSEMKTAPESSQSVIRTAYQADTQPAAPARHQLEPSVAKPDSVQALVSSETAAPLEVAEPQALQQKTRVYPPLMSLAATAVRATEIQPENQPVKHAVRESHATPGGEKTDLTVTTAAVTAVEMNTGSSDGAPFGQSMNENFLPNAMHQQVKTEAHPSVTSVAGAETVDASRTGHDADQVVQQVRERLVNHVTKPGNEQIVLRLSPEHLGELKVNLNMDGQRLKVEIVAENATVRDSLMQNTDLLKESLSRQNIKMESFDVTTGGNGTADSGRGQSDWRELAQRRQQNLWMPEGGYRLAKQATPAVAAYQAKSQHTMVDVHF